MIRIPELLAKLLVCFQEANPKVIVKTPFSKKESHYIKLLTQKYKDTVGKNRGKGVVKKK